MGILKASIPLFFLLIGIELLWSEWKGRRLSRLNDALSDVSCGVLSQLAGMFDKALTLGVFIWVATHLRVQLAAPWLPEWAERLPLVRGDNGRVAMDGAALASWAVVFVLVDLCYYWSHRCSHEINVLWAGHVVHHQSEEYNLSVALRQASLGKLLTWVFYVPLALVGVPWRMFVACHAINLVYQFVLHTRAVNRLGRPIEWLLNTPSHHRVHHGVNLKYQDKNYAGVFMMFDRWFGTFQVEEEEPVYGITTPLQSWNPVWANLQVFAQLGRDLRHTTRWRDKWRLVFGRPGWRPAELGGPHAKHEVDVTRYEKFDPRIPGVLAAYGLAQFVVASAAALFLLMRATSLPVGQSVAAAFYVMVALVCVGGVFERAQWARPLETARLAVLGLVAAVVAVMGIGPAALAWGGVAFAVVSVAVLWRYRGALTEPALASIM